MFKQYIFGYNNKHRILDRYIFTSLCISHKINKRLYLLDGISAENSRFKVNYLEPPDVVELKALLSFIEESCTTVDHPDGTDTYPAV